MADKKKKKQTAKQATKRASSAKKPEKAVKAKPVEKKPTAKAGTAQNRAVKAKQPSKPKTVKKNELKHSDKDELIIGTDKPIIVLGKGAKKLNRKKELKKVSQKGGYTAWDGRTGKTFATSKEAQDYAMDLLKHTGRLIQVTPTNRQVTHTFLAPEEKSKKK